MGTRAPVMIAGAGIGGLSLGLSLSALEYDVSIFEKNISLTDAPGALQLAPNATRILRRLNLLEAVQQAGCMPGGLSVFSAEENVRLTRFPFGEEMWRRWGAPYLVIRRGDLCKIFLDAIAARDNIQLNCGQRILGYSQASKYVTLQIEGKDKRLKGECLIGADGVHSVVRQQMQESVGHGWKYSGYTAWRTEICLSIGCTEKEQGSLSAESAQENAQASLQDVSLWLGHHYHLVLYPPLGKVLENKEGDQNSSGLSPSKNFQKRNLVLIVPEEEKVGMGYVNHVEIFPPSLYKRLNLRNPFLCNILSSPHKWERRPLYRRTLDKSWCSGPVALLGDAAHPILPFLAQGAAQALEDSSALAGLIQSHQGGNNIGSGKEKRSKEEPLCWEAVFKAYEKRRWDRVNSVQKASLWQGYLYHGGSNLCTPHAWIYSWLPLRTYAWGRNEILKRVSESKINKAYDWLYTP